MRYLFVQQIPYVLLNKILIVRDIIKIPISFEEMDK